MKLVAVVLAACVAVACCDSSFPQTFARPEPGYGGLTDLEQQKYGKLLNFFFDVENTPVGDFLKGAQFPNIEKIQQLSFHSIIDAMKTDEEFGRFAADQFVEYYKSYTARKASQPDVRAAAQTTGWDGCRLDYGAFVEPITNTLFNLALPTICEIVGPFLCNLLEELPVPEMPGWGLRMIDAMGKIPPGLTDGNIHWIGAYDMCMEDFIDVTYNNTLGAAVEERTFTGQYCRVQFRTVEPVLGNISLPLFIGLCVPDTCSVENVTAYISESNPIGGEGNFVLGAVLAFLGLGVENVYCGQEVDASADHGFQAVLGILIGLAVLAALASLYDGFLRPRWIQNYLKTLPRVPPMTPPMTPHTDVSNARVSSGYDNTGYVPYDANEKNTNNSAKHHPLDAQFSSTSTSPIIANQIKAQIEKENKIGFSDRLEMAFVGFSAYGNTRRIWKLTQDSDHIPVLNGVRVLTFGWAVLGYTWALGPLYAETWVTGNIRRMIFEYVPDWSMQFIINFHFTADTYFVISGLLTSYWWLKAYQKRGKITCGMSAHYILHRYWKLMVPLMISMGLYSTFYKFLGEGPLFPQSVNDADTCRAGHWWKNLVMVGNVVDTDNMCLAWMWYVPAVFQLHLVSILVLVPLVLVPWVGYIMMTAMYLATVGAAAGISHRIHSNEGISLVDWLIDYYFATWCRAAPYVIGLALGKIIFEIKRKNKTIYMHPVVAIIGWLLAIGLISTPVYITYDFLREGGDPWGVSQWVAWDTLSRTSLGLGVAWIIFACTVGYGGIITKFLSYPIWIPFSRLAYQSLITGAMLIFNRVYGLRLVLWVNQGSQMYAWYGNILASFSLGWVGCLVWVYPLTVGLEKAILCNKRIDWLRAGRHPREQVNEIEKEYKRVQSGKYEAPPPEKGNTYETKEALYNNANMSNSNLHQRLHPDVEGQKDDQISTPL